MTPFTRGRCLSAPMTALGRGVRGRGGMLGGFLFFSFLSFSSSFADLLSECSPGVFSDYEDLGKNLNRLTKALALTLLTP